MRLTISNLTTIILFLNFNILCSSLNVYAQTNETPQTIRGLEFSICKGETVQLSSLHQPPTVIQIVDENAQTSDPKNSLENPSTLTLEPNGPMIDYNCMPPVIEVVPDENWTLDENGAVVLSPLETTTYKVRYLSVDQCPNGRPTNITVNVACSVQNNRMADNFIWLNELINDEGCGINLIDVYEKNNSKFVYIEAINSKALYYEDGSVLCTDADLCLEVYNLSVKKNTWSCKQVKENEDAAHLIFSTYTWLEKEVDKENCANETIAVYDTGTYKFIVVYNGLNGYYIYDETGLYSYFTEIGLSYLDEFESFKLYGWACDGNFSVRKAATESNNTNAFQLFPNPTNGKVFLNLNPAKVPFFSKPTVSVYTISGQLLQQTQTQEDDFFVHLLELDVSSLNKGMYLVELKSNDNFSYEKLVVE